MTDYTKRRKAINTHKKKEQDMTVPIIFGAVIGFSALAVSALGGVNIIWFAGGIIFWIAWSRIK